VLASFWIFLAGPDRAPWTEAMREFYGRRHTAEIHIPWMMFGLVARPWTIASALLFILLAVFTGLEAFGSYVGAFM